jgi:deoxyribodipyrimidine photolyase-related protein
MSQFADGGIVGTKPYVSSASYINKMSHYCGDCFMISENWRKSVRSIACTGIFIIKTRIN